MSRVRIAEAGDLAAWDEEGVRLAASVDEDTADAYRMVMASLRRFAIDDEGRLPTPDEMERFVGASAMARQLAAAAVSRAERAQLLAFDATSLAVWIDIHGRLVHAGEGGRPAASLAGARGWAAVMAGAADEARGFAEQMRGLAKTEGLAAELIEASVIDAMATAEQGDVEAAVTIARRASRMSRTESLPQSEYLANLVLARLRRLSAKPHLATRILAALLRVATQPWRPWMSLELALAGARPELGDLGESASASAVRALGSALEAAGRGDRHTFDGAMAMALDATLAFSDVHRDLETFGALLDVRREQGNVTPFRRGHVDGVPRGLVGIAAGHGDETAFVIATEERAVRVLAPGVLLSAGAEVKRVEKSPGRQARTDATICTLLLAGLEGIEEEALFRRVYGFAYHGELHRGVRDVLYHRVRQRIEGLAELVRDAGMVTLRLAHAVVAPDPRAAPPPEHTLLLVLASSGHASAKDAAEALGIPVRTAQDALKRLAEDGACRAVKQGKALEYHLEDTTFLEPTKV